MLGAGDSSDDRVDIELREWGMEAEEAREFMSPRMDLKNGVAKPAAKPTKG